MAKQICVLCMKNKSKYKLSTNSSFEVCDICSANKERVLHLISTAKTEAELQNAMAYYDQKKKEWELADKDALNEVEEEVRLTTPQRLEDPFDESKFILGLDYLKNKTAQLRNENQEKLIIEVQGNRGRYLKVYEDRVAIITSPSLITFVTGNLTDGIKTIFYDDIIGLQFKKPGLICGYLQFETASPQQNNEQSNYFSENSFTFDGEETARTVMVIYDYVTEILRKIKKEKISFYSKSNQ